MEGDRQNQRQRYNKQRLDPNYSKRRVSQQTHNTWSKKYKSLIEKDTQDVLNPAIVPVEDAKLGAIECSLEVLDEEFENDDKSEGSVNQAEDYSHIIDECTSSPREATSFIQCSEVFSENHEAKDNTTSDLLMREKICAHDSGNEFSENEATEKVRARLFMEKRVMFKESNITVGDVAEMISAFSCRFGLVLEGRTKLFEMFRICAGPDFDNVKISNYMFSKVYDPPEDKITLHFYCNQCFGPLLETGRKAFQNDNAKKIICEKCTQEYELTLGSPNCYQTIELRYQIDQLLKRPEVAKAFVDKVKFQNNRTFDGKICDVDDSELQRAIIDKYPNAITYTIGTDGASAKNPMQCKTGFWPLQMLFNALPLSLRFRFIILFGVMIVRKDPSAELLNLFLKNFVDQAIALSKEDILVVVDGVTHKLKFIPLFSSVDSPARALMQNRIKHSGYFSCSYCYIRGLYACGAVRFPCEIHNSLLRSSASHHEDVQNALKSSIILNASRGVKGLAALADLEDFDIVWSFPFDYLHTLLLGPIQDTISPEYHFSPKVIRRLDARLTEVKPSHEVFTPPQKLSERSAWKGTAWKSWFLYYSLPMCIDLLPLNLMENYAILVKSMYTLLKTEISQGELLECKENIDKYLENFQQLYGLGSMKFNVHMLSHIVQSIICTGPMAVTSTFPFESNLSFLKNRVTGTKNMGLQMIMKSMQTMSYRCKARDFSSSPVVTAFCDSLFQEKKYTLSARIKKGITFFGNPKLSKNKDTVNANLFTKCIYKKQTFHSVDYNRGTKFNDTIVQLECGSIAQILEIIDMPNDGDCYLRVWKLKTTKMVVGKIEIPHIWEVTGIIEKMIVPFEKVRSKIIYLQFEDKNYACKPPNVIDSS